MQYQTKCRSLFIWTVICLLSAGNVAWAQNAKIKLGTLTCKSEGAVGLVLGSQEKLECALTPADGSDVRHYDGTITRIGLDIGVRGESVLVWTVLGSTTETSYENLGGEFAGVSADVAAGIGVGANVLVGGNQKSVVLQPVSVKGGTGIALAAGVSGFSLKPAD